MGKQRDGVRDSVTVLLTLILLVVAAVPAYAQQVPAAADNPIAEAPVRFGPIGIAPRFALQNIGVDNNVFNTTANEQSDYTFTGRVGADVWLRTGRGLLSATGWVEYVYFQDFESERAYNNYAKGQYEWRFNRLRPYASASTLDTRERPGWEIDERVRRYETEFHAGTDVRIAPKTNLRLDLRQQDYEYEEDESQGGRHYDQSLNRRLESAEFSYRQQLTALTTWVARVTREQERFEFESLRNSDTFRATTGFELGRFALIRGTALVGYRKLSTAAGGTFPEFSGLTSNVNVTYSAPTQTRLNAIFNRDIQYSYEDRTPYYVLTQWSGTVTHRVVGGWDVQVTGGRDRLDYQSLAAILERTDSISRYGGGIGYTIGESLRVGFDVQSFYRSSPIRSREYQNMRAGLSVTYGN
jgi:hypothetical protein